MLIVVLYTSWLDRSFFTGVGQKFERTVTIYEITRFVMDSRIGTIALKPFLIGMLRRTPDSLDIIAVYYDAYSIGIC